MLGPTCGRGALFYTPELPSDLHFDTRPRRVTTSVRVFGVKSQTINGAHILLALACHWAPSGLGLYASLCYCNHKGLTDARKSCPLTPNVPFGLAKSHDDVTSPYLADQTI